MITLITTDGTDLQDKLRFNAFTDIAATGDVCKHYGGQTDCTRSVAGAYAHVASQDIIELQSTRTSYPDELARIETLANRPAIAGGAPTEIRGCACSATRPGFASHGPRCEGRAGGCCGACDRRWEWRGEPGSTDLVHETHDGETYRIRWQADRRRWVAECSRGGIGPGYPTLIWAMDACARTAGQSSAAHTWPMASPLISGGAVQDYDDLPGWDPIADREVRLEVVHVDGPALVLRAAWREPYAGRMGWPTKPAFFLLVCTQCWAMVDGNGYPQLEAKISNARKHCGLLDHQRAPETERNTA